MSGPSLKSSEGWPRGEPSGPPRSQWGLVAPVVLSTGSGVDLKNGHNPQVESYILFGGSF